MGSAEKYAKLGNDYHWQPGWPEGDYGQWVRRALSYFPETVEDSDILDVGCGDGYPASLLDKRGYSVHGVDELEGPLAVAREKVPAGFFSQEWPETATSYVLALEVLEHMGDPGPLVAAVRRCDRYAIVTCPPPGMDPYAVREYDRAGIERLFEGCRVEHLVDEGEHQLYRISPQPALTLTLSQREREEDVVSEGEEAEVQPEEQAAEELPAAVKRGRGRPRKVRPMDKLLGEL